MSLSDIAPVLPDHVLPDHAHHWLIADQNGPSSEGTCKSCGETRDFVNAYHRTYRTTVFFNARTRSPLPTK